MSDFKIKISNLDRLSVIRVLLLVIYDLAAIEVASFMALFIRFDFTMNDEMVRYLAIYRQHQILVMGITIIIFAACRLYTSIWSYASIREMMNIMLASILYMLLVTAVYDFLEPESNGMPRSFYLLSAAFLFVLVFFVRFIYRAIREFRGLTNKNRVTKRVMVIGAGAAGAGLIKEIKANPSLKKKLVCIVDDDTTKVGKRMFGVFVAGTTEDIPNLVKSYVIDQILIAMPSASAEERKRILDICKTTGCEMMIIPGIYQIIRGDVSVSQLKHVDVNDLLGREPIEVDIDSIMGYVKDKVIMVTGAGGSIGSELCRQIASHQPKQLIMLDIYENTTYEVQNELKANFPELNLVVLIASVRNTARIDHIFEMYRPDIVYHAAAHKHVPLMEANPNEAIKNNVLGTWKVVMASDKWKVSKFVLISTDKAVNPTSIMGASKRICEMLVQTYNNHSETDFVAVRFGNVLGSHGSVIPLFKRQIAEGGPVTVTHPDIIRYFMTIPEAVSLVLQAGAFAKGGEIFVLDMGKPVKIDDLARNLILLSGLKPDIDIKIKYVGLRPGEKLYEELLMDEEGLQDTENKLIHIGHPIKLDEEKFIKQIEDLSDYVQKEPDDIKRYVKNIVPTYNPKN
ncbi:polysaccharide biosynthesis protein [Mobilibacterium timonense]|uniref:polysaccharide biosynthesis protein n=1 Tax=Mobilibacterium timonense TaxID=1871012 RepID=UPI000985E2F9|nr:nucleoside-diphosphate sugar epimerase/dehydratase [Mobilibacterium timonense]